jgi:hypothetical protein
MLEELFFMQQPGLFDLSMYQTCSFHFIPMVGTATEPPLTCYLLLEQT